MNWKFWKKNNPSDPQNDQEPSWLNRCWSRITAWKIPHFFEAIRNFFKNWRGWWLWNVLSTLDFWPSPKEPNEVDAFMKDAKLPQKRKEQAKQKPQESGQESALKKFLKSWQKVTTADEFMEGANLLSSTGEPGRRRHYLLIGCLLFIIFAVGWSAFAKIDIVTKGIGKVIPAGKVQVVQHLEGGIVSKILVREGDHVTKGQILMEVDDVNYASLYSAGLLKLATLQAKIARLTAEINGTPFVLPSGFDKRYKLYSDSEYQAYLENIGSLDSKLKTLKEQILQRRDELAGLKERREKLETSYKLIVEELNMTKELYQEGAAAKVEVLRIERQASDAAGDLDELKTNETRASNAINEAINKLDELGDEFRSQAARDLVAAKADLAEQEETNIALQDRARRTILRAPVTGIVNVLHVNTVGGTIKPGEELIDIVPTGENLLVEVKVLPSDIAFIYPGQAATVKITAYDYTIYGGLQGKVEFISADSITDKEGKSYYLVTVRTEKDYLGKPDKPLSIIPGMTAEVDILTGERTVLTYVMKPLLRASESAWREK